MAPSKTTVLRGNANKHRWERLTRPRAIRRWYRMYLEGQAHLQRPSFPQSPHRLLVFVLIDKVSPSSLVTEPFFIVSRFYPVVAPEWGERRVLALMESSKHQKIKNSLTVSPPPPTLLTFRTAPTTANTTIFK